MALNTIDEILADLRQGKMVIIMDDEDRENEGDLLMAAWDEPYPVAACTIRRVSATQTDLIYYSVTTAVAADSDHPATPRSPSK